MIANYHTHSRWCRHGVGEIEEYIEEAIRQGFCELAITEHVPHEHSFTWIPWESVPAFDRELNRCIEKYQGQIRVRKGFECEYYPEDLDSYRRFQDMGYELLILGQHASGKKHDINIFEKKGADVLAIYADEICKGLETGMFRLLAHPDCALHNYTGGWDRYAEAAMDQIFQAASELHIPVEINGNGIRVGRFYPSKEAFTLAKKYDLQYMVNADAHNPAFLYDDAVKKAEKMAEELGITLLQRLP